MDGGAVATAVVLDVITCLLYQVEATAAGGVGGRQGRRGEHLVLAVNEAAANVIEHGGGGGELELIKDDQRLLIAEVSDAGPGLPAGMTIAARRTPGGWRGESSVVVALQL